MYLKNLEKVFVKILSDGVIINGLKQGTHVSFTPDGYNVIRYKNDMLQGECIYICNHLTIVINYYNNRKFGKYLCYDKHRRILTEKYYVNGIETWSHKLRLRQYFP